MDLLDNPLCSNLSWRQFEMVKHRLTKLTDCDALKKFGKYPLLKTLQRSINGAVWSQAYSLCPIFVFALLLHDSEIHFLKFFVSISRKLSPKTGKKLKYSPANCASKVTSAKAKPHFTPVNSRPNLKISSHPGGWRHLWPLNCNTVRGALQLWGWGVPILLLFCWFDPPAPRYTSKFRMHNMQSPLISVHVAIHVHICMRSIAICVESVLHDVLYTAKYWTLTIQMCNNRWPACRSQSMPL